MFANIDTLALPANDKGGQRNKQTNKQTNKQNQKTNKQKNTSIWIPIFADKYREDDIWKSVIEKGY